MIHARGIALLGTAAFVKEHYGPEAHEAILRDLPPDTAAAFAVELREAGWKPFRHLAAYVEVVRARFAPDEPGFHRRLAAYVGHLERRLGGFEPMVVTPQIAMKMAPMVWRCLWDAGRVEFLAEGPTAGRLRVHDFPANPMLCGMIAGALEGLTSSDASRAEVIDVACRDRGDPQCVFRVEWNAVGRV